MTLFGCSNISYEIASLIARGQALQTQNSLLQNDVYRKSSILNKDMECALRSKHRPVNIFRLIYLYESFKEYFLFALFSRTVSVDCEAFVVVIVDVVVVGRA